MASRLPSTRQIWTKKRLRLYYYPHRLPPYLPLLFHRSISSSPGPNTEFHVTRPPGRYIVPFSPAHDRRSTIVPRAVNIERPSPRVVGLILNRPESLNAMNADMIDTLLSQITRFASDDENIRCLVIIGEGTSFCSGQDLKQSMTSVGIDHPKYEEELRAALEKLQTITKMLVGSDTFVISAVHGYAVGGGAELALAADYVLADESAVFSFPEVGIGQIATGGITKRLSKMVGLMRAKELLFTGRKVSAKEGYGMGLVSEVVSDGKLLKKRAYDFAESIAEMSATSVSETKRRVEYDNRIQETLEQEIDSAVKCMTSEAGRRIYRQFLYRRTPFRSPVRRYGLNEKKSYKSASPLSGTTSNATTTTTTTEEKQMSIRFTNEKRTFFTFLKEEFFEEELTWQDLIGDEERMYFVWFERRYERDKLMELDKVYGAYGIKIEPSWVEYNQLLRRQMKLDLESRNGHKALSVIKEQREEIERIKKTTLRRNQAVEDARRAMNAQEYYPSGVTSAVMHDLEKFLEKWNDVWKMRWMFQQKYKTLGTHRAFWQKTLQDIGGDFRDKYSVEEWQKDVAAMYNAHATKSGKALIVRKLSRAEGRKGTGSIQVLKPKVLGSEELTWEKNTFSSKSTRKRAKEDLEAAERNGPKKWAHTVEKNLTGKKDETPPQTLNHLLSCRIAEGKDRAFLRCLDWKETGLHNFYEQVVLMAKGLQTQAGIGPGDRVIVAMRPSPLAACTWFAVNRVGGIWCPIDPFNPDPVHCSRMNPKIAIIDSEFKDDLNTVLPVDVEFFLDDYIIKLAGSLSSAMSSQFMYQASPSDTSVEFPDGRSFPHGWLTQKAVEHGRRTQIGTTDVLYSPAAMHTVDVMAQTILPAMIFGCTAALTPFHDKEDIWDEVDHFNATSVGIHRKEMIKYLATAPNAPKYLQDVGPKKWKGLEKLWVNEKISDAQKNSIERKNGIVVVQASKGLPLEED